MKRLLFTLSTLLCLSASAQTIDFGDAAPAKIDSIDKKILDKAIFEVTYSYTYALDAEKPWDTRSGVTLLQIGDRYNRFCDYYHFLFDAVIDEAARKKQSFIEVASRSMSTLSNEKFCESIVVDKKKQKETIQRTAGLTQLYQYEESLPSLQWEMLDGDTVIAGYACNKAKTSLFGRDYIAWYAPEVDMPYGPYKFNGLPGLIFRVTDTKVNFDFTLTGLEKVSGVVPVYQWAAKDIVKTDRKTVRKIYKNFCADPVSALAGMDGVIIPEETKATINAKPYNPIELE